MLYRRVFDKISTEFRNTFHVFVNFAGFSWIYLNSAAPQPHEISEALSSLKCTAVCINKIMHKLQLMYFCCGFFF